MSKPRRILAVSSGGGHWVELMRLRPAFEGHDVAFVTEIPLTATGKMQKLKLREQFKDYKLPAA